MLELTTVVGIGSSVFTGISLLPQLIKLIKDKHPGGISYLTLLSLFIGLSLWVFYGFLKHDWIIIVSNGFSLLVNVTIGILSLVYKRQSTGHSKV